MDETARAGRSGWAELLDLAPEDGQPIFRQIYLKLRGAILSNVLAPGSRLPSTRGLAERIGVSRTSVLSAYAQLLAEGFLIGREGSGTYVAQDVPRAIRPDTPAGGQPTPGRQTLSEAGLRYQSVAETLPAPSQAAFTVGCCSIDGTTLEAWRRIGAQQMRALDPVNLHYADPRGEPGLRLEVADYLRAARGVQCEPDQILILSGAQQAIDLSIRTLLAPGDTVWVEDPGYLATRAALLAAGARLVPVPVDESGLVVRAGIAAGPAARAVHITPSHQFPTGAVMSLARRLELLDWARHSGAWIIEDDYDSEFRYVGRPLASLQGLDGGNSVIYVGTLSKVLFPGLRLGFAVVPRQAVAAFTGARFLADRHPPTLLQAMTADFMRQGQLTGHIRRMRQLYRMQRDTLVAALRRLLGDLVEIEVPDCGIQLVLHFRRPIPDVAVAAAAAVQGVVVRPVSPLYLDAPPRQGLVLGFSGFDPDQLMEAAAKLARAVRQVA